MQRASETIFRTYFTINWAFQNISSNLTAIRNIYSLEDMSKTFVDGDLKYPSVGSKHGGAEIEFRCVFLKCDYRDIEGVVVEMYHSPTLAKRKTPLMVFLSQSSQGSWLSSSA